MITVPVFFSCDDNYLPFLSVAIRSLIYNSNKDNFYKIYILNSELNETSTNRIIKMATDNVSIEFVDVSKKIIPLTQHLSLRDYYTFSIYFRLFIPSMFPEFDKAIYLDSDVIVMEDIANMYNINLDDNLLGGVPDEIIDSQQVFRDYAEKACGIKYQKYINSGVLLMNLKGLRKFDIESKFLFLLKKYHFQTIAPDQDYLNVLCKDKIVYLDKGWDKMSINDEYDGIPHLIHFNMFNKPWQYDGIFYDKYFWKYAERTDFYDEIINIKKNFTEKEAQEQQQGLKMLVENAGKLINDENNFNRVLSERSEVLL